jgi:putative ATPase
MSLFEDKQPDQTTKPLAGRLRPESLEGFVGQTHLVGATGAFRGAIERGTLGSVILWGPAGCGKTTLARIIANCAESYIEIRSAVTTGVSDIRRITEEAKKRSRPTTLFLDEIHHFSRTQQDSLLGSIEEGIFTLIGATTENPAFSLATPLISRCRVLVLRPLSSEELSELIARGKSELGVTLSTDAETQLIRWANGDARFALSGLELAAQLAHPSKDIIAEHIAAAIDRPLLRYDAHGDQHYDVISAFIKSVRGSDVDASLHYLARMISAGEDPRFIARRLIVLASEDIGNAQPLGLLVATATLQVVERIGMPEARIALAHATTFLASSPKSNAAYLGLEKALDDIRKKSSPPVPDYLRDPNTRVFEETKDPGNYLYPHDYGGWVAQKYLEEPHGLSLPYYIPTDNGYEKKISAWLSELKVLENEENAPENGN